MMHSSTITSKGTVTIPALFRQQLGLKEGDVVQFQLRGGAIIATPKLGWDEFFAHTNDFGKKARAMIKNGSKTVLKSNADIATAAQEGRARGY